MKNKSNSNSKKRISEPTPAPQPERAIYGFFLFIAAIISFILYIIVSFLPQNVLTNLGWTYLPDKYWSIAIPAFIILTALTIWPLYFSLNMTKVNRFDSIDNIQDEYTLSKQTETKSNNYSKYSIDPAYDIPLTDMSRYLFKK